MKKTLFKLATLATAGYMLATSAFADGPDTEGDALYQAKLDSIAKAKQDSIDFRKEVEKYLPPEVREAKKDTSKTNTTYVPPGKEDPSFIPSSTDYETIKNTPEKIIGTEKSEIDTVQTKVIGKPSLEEIAKQDSSYTVSKDIPEPQKPKPGIQDDNQYETFNTDSIAKFKQDSIAAQYTQDIEFLEKLIYEPGTALSFGLDPNTFYIIANKEVAPEDSAKLKEVFNRYIGEKEFTLFEKEYSTFLNDNPDTKDMAFDFISKFHQAYQDKIDDYNDLSGKLTTNEIKLNKEQNRASKYQEYFLNLASSTNIQIGRLGYADSQDINYALLNAVVIPGKKLNVVLGAGITEKLDLDPRNQSTRSVYVGSTTDNMLTEDDFYTINTTTDEITQSSETFDKQKQPLYLMGVKYNTDNSVVKGITLNYLVGQVGLDKETNTYLQQTSNVTGSNGLTTTNIATSLPDMTKQDLVEYFGSLGLTFEIPGGLNFGFTTTNPNGMNPVENIRENIFGINAGYSIGDWTNRITNKNGNE